MKYRIVIMAAAVALVSALSLSVAGVGALAADKLKIGFIYLGPIGDFGWTYQHEVARQALVKALGDKVETTYLENVNEGPELGTRHRAVGTGRQPPDLHHLFRLHGPDHQGGKQVPQRLL